MRLEIDPDGGSGVLRGEPNRSATITYDLQKDWTGPLVHPRQFHPVLMPEYFEFTGQNALVFPRLDTPAKRVALTTAHLDFTQLPSSWALATSFGAGTSTAGVGGTAGSGGASSNGGVANSSSTLGWAGGGSTTTSGARRVRTPTSPMTTPATRMARTTAMMTISTPPVFHRALGELFVGDSPMVAYADG